MDRNGFTGLHAAGLEERLKEHFQAIGGLCAEGEKVIARELVRRARAEERVRQALRRLLSAVQWLDPDGLPLAAGSARELRAAVEQARGELRAPVEPAGQRPTK